MKKTLWLAGSLILGLITCRPGTMDSGREIDFGIYEVLDPVQLTSSISARLLELQVQVPDSAGVFVAGQTLQHGPEWREALSAIGTDEGVRMAETAVPEHEGNALYSVIALRNPPVINASDIRKAIGETDKVAIRMTRKGAKKWAGMTERNQGKYVAFLLEGQVYNIPMVAAPIRTGEALITGLDPTEAARIAAILNGEEVQ